MASLIEYSDVEDFQPDADFAKTERLIAGISRKVEDKLGFSLAYASGTERVESKGGKILSLHRYPLYSVEAVTYGGFEVGGWERYPDGNRWGHLRRISGSWPVRHRSIPLVPYGHHEPLGLEVTYAAGYRLPGQSGVPSDVPTLPEDVVLDLIDWVRNRLVGRNTEISQGGQYVQSQQLGSMKLVVGKVAASSSPEAIELRLVESIVNRLRRPRCP